MIARRVTFHAETRGDLFEPSQVQNSREIGVDLAGPVITSARNFNPLLLPTESRKRVLGRMEEGRKTPARREKSNELKRFRDLLIFRSRTCGAEPLQNSEIVDKHLGVGGAESSLKDF